MNMASLNGIILSLVTFLPAAGALLLVFFPRRDRDIKWFALGISIITFLVSLHLPARFADSVLQTNRRRLGPACPMQSDAIHGYALPEGDCIGRWYRRLARYRLTAR